mgnify:CR=1 FL=1
MKRYMHGMRYKKLICVLLCLILGTLIIVFSLYFSNQINKKSVACPDVSVSIDAEMISENDTTIYWKVRNKSNEDLTFKDNNIRLCMLDSKNYPLENISDVILKPEELYEYQFTIKNIAKGHHTIKLTAKCEEGTQASMSYSFEIE